MVIDFLHYVDPFDQNNLADYLSCVPNLEELCIYREYQDANITSDLSHYWIDILVDHHLSSLRRLKYHLRIYLSEELIINDSENILKRLEENFSDIHSDRYQSKFVFKLCSGPILD